MAAHPDESPVLQHLEELRLDGQIETANLVQKKGAVVGELDPAEFGRHGAGKAPFS